MSKENVCRTCGEEAPSSLGAQKHCVAKPLHSPAPWYVEVHQNETTIECDLQTVATNVSNRDADIIAAAPDMLAALKAVFQARAPQLNFDFSNAPDMQMLEKAIKKAEGK